MRPSLFLFFVDPSLLPIVSHSIDCFFHYCLTIVSHPTIVEYQIIGFYWCSFSYTSVGYTKDEKIRHSGTYFLLVLWK
jgi:hypothetical protein